MMQRHTTQTTSVLIGDVCATGDCWTGFTLPKAKGLLVHGRTLTIDAVGEDAVQIRHESRVAQQIALSYRHTFAYECPQRV